MNTTANAQNPNAGLQKWSLIAGSWHLDYTLQNGLGLGKEYSVAGLDPSLSPATDGLRNISGKVNPDGTVTIFAITSTISGSGDQGADPNKLVSITDRLEATSLPSHEQFNVLETAGFGQVLASDRFSVASLSPRAGTRKSLAVLIVSDANITWEPPRAIAPATISSMAMAPIIVVS